jgi:hypothetical protein
LKETIDDLWAYIEKDSEGHERIVLSPPERGKAYGLEKYSPLVFSSELTALSYGRVVREYAFSFNQRVKLIRFSFSDIVKVYDPGAVEDDSN